MSRISNSGSKPKLACEIAADRVLVGRISDIGGRTLEACASSELAPGTVVPDLIEANLRQPDAVYETIRDTLGSVGARSRDVIAVLPDAAVRVVLLDFETLPPKREEAESVVRFRLKKSLPFDVDKAKVSYHVQSSKGGVRVIAAVALTNVVEDYEAVFRQAGYEPGVVLPSMLAALGAADAPKPSLIIKVDARTTSIAILDRDQLLLFRTLENTRGVTVTRGAAGGGGLSFSGILSGYLPDEYRSDFCGRVAGIRQRLPCPSRSDRRRRKGSGVAFTTGRRRGFDSQVEDGRGGRSSAFLTCALTSISPPALTKTRARCGCAGAERWLTWTVDLDSAVHGAIRIASARKDRS